MSAQDGSDTAEQCEQHYRRQNDSDSSQRFYQPKQGKLFSVTLRPSDTKQGKDPHLPVVTSADQPFFPVPLSP